MKDDKTACLRTKLNPSGRKTKSKHINKFICDNKVWQVQNCLSEFLCLQYLTSLWALSAVWLWDKRMIDLFCCSDRQSTFRCSNLITQNKGKRWEDMGQSWRETVEQTLPGRRDEGMIDEGEERCCRDSQVEDVLALFVCCLVWRGWKVQSYSKWNL